MALKIVFITHYSDLYGANRSLLGLIDGLREYNVSPLVICPSRGRLTETLKKKQIQYNVVHFKTWLAKNTGWTRLKLPLRILANVLVLPLIVKAIKGFDADLVYTNSSCTQIGQSAASILKLPHIWHIREFGWEDFSLKCDLGERYFQKMFNKADAVISVSEILKIKKLYFLRKPAYVVYNGVMNEQQANNLIKHNRSEPFSFVILGKVSQEKGLEHAVRAISLMKKPDVRLYICGEGKPVYLIHLKALAESLNISDQIIFTGFIANPFEILQKSDCLLMCSQNEAMGRVTVEAMFAGLPVIGYRGGATPELVEDGVNGLLYKNGCEHLADCMKKIVENPQLSTELGKNGKQKVLQDFTIEKYACKILDIIRNTTMRC